MNNTNNNSITSINLNSNLKNKPKIKCPLFNKKINSIKKYAAMKAVLLAKIISSTLLGDQINLYKNKIFNQKIKNGIPISSVSHNSSQYIKYKYLNQQNNSILKQKMCPNKTNSNIIINKTNNNISNLSLNKNNKLAKSNTISKKKKSNIKSINTNNYIINTFNLSEKNYINNNNQTKTYNR